MLLPLILSRLLKHRTTRSPNARFVCMAELFCSRCQTRVFLIHSLRKTKPVTAPGYNNIHVEFLKNLGPKARTWLSKFFSRIMATHSIPKIWRKAKVIAIEKPGKDPSLAANYHPTSLLSVLQAPEASCTPAHFSHSRRFTQSRPGWFPERSKHL